MKLRRLLPVGLLLSLLSVATTAHAAGTVSVTDYGADPTGTNNSTAAFQNAISALDAQGGGTLNIPPGTYVINPDVVNVHGNTTVQGTGATVRSSGFGYNLLGLSGSNLDVEGLTVDGAFEVLHVVEIGSGLNNVTMHSATVEDGGQSNDPTSANYNAQVVGVRVEGGGSNMVFDTIHVKNVTATHEAPSSDSPNGKSMFARGLLLDNSGSTTVTNHVTVANSTFDEVGPKDDGDCLVIQNTDGTDANLVIQNNTFTACHKRAIKVQVPGVTIVGNTINNPFFGNNAYKVQPEPVGGPTFDMFAAIAVDNSNVTVSQNTTTGTGSFYMGVELAGNSTLQNITITGNSIANGAGSNTSAPSSMVRSFQPTNRLIITYNTFTNAPWGIWLADPVTQATIQCNTYVAVTHQTVYPNGTEQPCVTPPTGGGGGGGGGAPGPAATPELDSLVLFGSGLAGVYAYVRRRHAARSTR